MCEDILGPNKFEFTKMISDKVTYFNKNVLGQRCLDFGNIGLRSDWSVIVSWLRSNFQNPFNFLEQVGRNGFHPIVVYAGFIPNK